VEKSRFLKKKKKIGKSHEILEKKCGNMCLLFFPIEKNVKVASLVGTAGEGVLVTAAAIPFCVTVDLNDRRSSRQRHTIDMNRRYRRAEKVTGTSRSSSSNPRGHCSRTVACFSLDASTKNSAIAAYCLECEKQSVYKRIAYSITKE
jgi:hypothetical protein